MNDSAEPNNAYEPHVPESVQTVPKLPKPGTAAGNWAEELAFEVALGYFPPEDLQERFGIDPRLWDKIMAMPEFKRSVQSYRKEIDDEGIAFKLRARRCAELLLDELTVMGFDRRADFADRQRAIEMIVRYAGMDNKTAKDDGPGFKLVINTNLGLSNDRQSGAYTVTVPATQKALEGDCGE